MKLAKSLLLGSAAGLFAVAGAQAADLPVKKAAPVEYVRVCSAYGAGFFFIPGTDTCLRIAGRVRAEYRVVETFDRSQSAGGFRLRTQLNADARTQTAYGTLRTFIRLRNETNTGNYFSGALTVNNSLLPESYSVEVNQGFVQFAGLTAGRIESFFSFYADNLNWTGFGTGSDTYGNNPIVFAYTATFGSGFSATLSVESPEVRRTTSTALAAGGRPAIIYGGEQLPDIVGSLRVDQAWGSAQIAGAIHEVRSLSQRVPAGVVGAGTYADTEYGFAVMAGAKINLPMIAPGDQLWLEATYSSGAVSYNGFGTGNFNNGGFGIVAADAYLNAFGNIKLTEAFTGTAAFLHYWTPQIRQAVFGSYTRLDFGGSVTTPFIGGTLVRPAGSQADTDFFQIGTNLIWSPVRDLDLGVEVAYLRSDLRGIGRIQDATVTGLATGRTISGDSAFQGRIRVQRDF